MYLVSCSTTCNVVCLPQSLEYIGFVCPLGDDESARTDTAVGVLDFDGWEKQSQQNTHSTVAGKETAVFCHDSHTLTPLQLETLSWGKLSRMTIFLNLV